MPLRLKRASANELPAPKLLVYKSLRMSDDWYGSNTMPSVDMAKGYVKSMSAMLSENLISEELIEAQKAPAAKRNLTL